MIFPPPHELTNELEGEYCYYDACEEKAVTTRYDRFMSEWFPVCEKHRSTDP